MTSNDLKIPSDKLVFIPLGGVGEFGRNMYLYGFGGKWIIIDLGVGFTDETPGVDFTLPDPSFIERERKNILGLFISHAHQDHIGAIPYLWTRLKCPIYASPFALAMIEGRLDESGLLGRVPLNPIQKGETISLSPFTIESVHINHSVPETLFFKIETPAGIVVHAIDWKFDENPIIEKKADIDRIRAIGEGGVMALMCDSTNIEIPGFAPSEAKAAEGLKDLFKEMRGTRIIVTLFSSNVARLRTISNAAAALGRKVCLVGRSLWTVDDAARSTGYLTDIPEFLTEEEADDLPDGEIVYVCTGSQGEARSVLSRASFATHKTFRIQKGDTIIFSARQIPGNEQAIKNMQSRLALMGASILTNNDTFVHSSGHAMKEDVRLMYQLLRPNLVIPIHGEPSQLREQSRLAEEEKIPHVLEITDGDVVQIEPENPRVIGQAPVGVLVIDGSRVVPLQSDIISKRKKMIFEGSLTVTLALTADRKILGQIQVSAPGLFEKDSSEIEKIKSIITKEIPKIPDAAFFDDEAVKTALRTPIKKYVKDLTSKKPVAEIHLIRL